MTEVEINELEALMVENRHSTWTSQHPEFQYEVAILTAAPELLKAAKAAQRYREALERLRLFFVLSTPEIRTCNDSFVAEKIIEASNICSEALEERSK